MDGIGTSMTARASSALFNQVMREQQNFDAAPFPASPTLAPGDLVALTPPGPNATPQDFNSFMQKLIAAKRAAIASAARRGGSGRPVDPNKPSQAQTGPVKVNAHGFQEGDKFVPVQQIRIYEVNNYGHRTYQTFGGNYEQYSWRMDDAKVGKDYKVQVTWANGYSETRDVHMGSTSGASLDIYRY
jgi:hypothetical protein